MRWDAIYKRIHGLKNPIGAEIGVFQAELSRNILFMHQNLRWVLIDPWSENTYEGVSPDAVSDKYRDIYQDNSLENYVKVVKLVHDNFYNRALVLKLYSQIAASIYANHSFDIIFIDAAHDYNSAIEDITAWWPKVKPGGYLCGHDYDVENFPGVKKAVDRFFVPESGRIELDDDFTWFVRKQ